MKIASNIHNSYTYIHILIYFFLKCDPLDVRLLCIILIFVLIVILKITRLKTFLIILSRKFITCTRIRSTRSERIMSNCKRIPSPFCNSIYPNTYAEYHFVVKTRSLDALFRV